MLQMQKTMMQGHPGSFSIHILTGLVPPKPGMRLAQAPTYHLCHTGTEQGNGFKARLRHCQRLWLYSPYTEAPPRSKFLLFQQPRALPYLHSTALLPSGPFSLTLQQALSGSRLAATPAQTRLQD